MSIVSTVSWMPSTVTMPRLAGVHDTLLASPRTIASMPTFLSDAISHLRSVEQIIAVTHSEDFASRSEHLIRVRKEAGKSATALER